MINISYLIKKYCIYLKYNASFYHFWISTIDEQEDDPVQKESENEYEENLRLPNFLNLSHDSSISNGKYKLITEVIAYLTH